MNKSTKDRIQGRLRHYLVRYRTSREITQREAAENLGYSTPAYQKFESTTQSENALVHAIELVTRFAEIEGLEPHEFVAQLTQTKRIPKGQNGKIRKWEQEHLHMLQHVSANIRKRWSETLLETPVNQLGFLLSVHTVLAELSRESLNLVYQVARRLS